MNAKYLDGLLGYVVGDAMGIPLETKKREELLKNPVTKMLDGGIFKLDVGTWSSNTSFLLATIDSINTKSIIDYDDIALKMNTIKNHGNYTPYGEMINIPVSTLKALDCFEESNSNAIECGKEEIVDALSLIRMLPLAYYCFETHKKDVEILQLVRELSSITHKSDVCVMGCYIYVRLCLFLLSGKDKLSAYNMIRCVDYSMFGDEVSSKYDFIINDDISKRKVDEISSSVDIVDVLGAAIWLFLKSDSYSESIIGAINLGEATSEIACITGSLTGLVYGADTIPKKWSDLLMKKDYLLDIFEEFSENKYSVN